MNTDVIVVGAGPAGLTMAAELAAAGVRTLVLERRVEGVQSRAGTILPRLLELLDARGIADRFIDKTRSINPYPFRHSHIWSGIPNIEWRHLDSRFGFTLGLPQNHTEEILRDWALESGAQLQYGMEVCAVRQDDDGVEVDVKNAAGQLTQVRGSYLIGADGGRSVVRRETGIPFEGREGTFRGIVIDTELQAPWQKGYADIDNEMGWIRGYAFGEGITRFNIVHRERRQAPKDEPVTLEEALQCLRDVHGTDYGIRSYRWASRFDDHMRSVPRLRQGRVFLVGESARVHYPASGVGMNFCIQDAFNLGWKLAQVVKGISPKEILDTYNSERLPVMQELLRSVLAQCALQFNFSPEGVQLKRRMAEYFISCEQVQRKLVLELCGLTLAYATGNCEHPLVGRTVPDIDVLTPEGGVHRITALLRDRQFLLLDLDGRANDFSGLRSGDAPVKFLAGGASRVTSAMQGTKAMLVRPDGYVAWASNVAVTAKDLKEPLEQWFSSSVIG